MQRLMPKINIATVSGRYWAMDRDNNWDRVEKYFQCVTQGTGELAETAVQAIDQGYAYAKAGKNTTGDSDEFIMPTLIDERGLIRDNDSVIFFNFRPDRAKEISKRLGEDSGLKNLHYACFTEYSNELKLPVAFTNATLPKQDYSMNLGELVSSAAMNQFRVAETEKFNHVTNFFNSSRKEPYPNEDRVLVPSPKVATYDLQPEMSLPGVTEKLLEAMTNKEKDYKLIVCNFANPDMVGHTGIWKAVITALESIDKSLERVVKTAQETGYVVMLTADHGNADQMLNIDDGVRTAHSCNPVPFIIINSKTDVKLREPCANPADLSASLSLANIAPTVCQYLGLEQPPQMKSRSLLA
jgi:2,3-bisphosphoglycerate-independent phosphoglycerate mutase